MAQIIEPMLKTKLGAQTGRQNWKFYSEIGSEDKVMRLRLEKNALVITVRDLDRRKDFSFGSTGEYLGKILILLLKKIQMTNSKKNV